MTSKGPLHGLRVLEMGQLIAIPSAMKMLADMGAQVIRMESIHRLESYRNASLYENNSEGAFWNRGANFYEQNRNKLGLTLDLSKPEGLSILKELIKVSDIFAENFTPRVMKSFGIEYEDLVKIKPDLIMVSSTGYGFDGPWANFGATGPATESASGMAIMTGYHNDMPIMPEIPYIDYTAAEHTVFAIMSALIHRMSTGEGQFIDISQTETASATVPEALLDFIVNGRVEPRHGNDDPVMAPHGCFRCKGQDKWITIAVQNDHEWKTLCEILNIEEAQAKSKDYSSTLDRWTNRNELHKLIDNHTKDWDNHKLTHLLQSNGVAAGSVMESPDLLFDKHLQDRGFYEVVEHHPSTGMPPLPYASRPWKFSETSAVTPKAAPIMGENNEFILKELLGKTDEEFDELVATQIIGNKPTQGTAVRAPDPNEQLRQGRMQRYDSDFKQKISEFYGTNK
ncbi:MAG: CoA transferase [SAR202 cluster bacterium]|nr:CoA transferase [SAR202 cluster bacterium]|tara:strand:- start:2988 stop:4349 length:1362 start_codon:yes stop_codon:yes gene_type:complete